MLDGITLDQLRTVLAVAECGSFRAAAHQRNCVPSAVSQTIAQCEAQLGVKLFDRTSYRASITEGGLQLLADMRAIIAGTHFLRARANAISSGVEPVLEVALDPLFPLPDFCAAIASLRREHPTLSLNILSGALGGPAQLVRSKRAHIGFSATAQITGNDFIHEALGWMQMYAVAAPEYLLKINDGKDASSGMLDTIQIVLSDPTDASGPDNFGVVAPRTWRVSDLAVKRQLILDGQGWGGLPSWLITRDLDDDRLKRIAPPGYGVDGGTMLQCSCIYRVDQPIGPLGAALLTSLRNSIGIQSSFVDHDIVT